MIVETVQAELCELKHNEADIEWFVDKELQLSHLNANDVAWEDSLTDSVGLFRYMLCFTFAFYYLDSTSFLQVFACLPIEGIIH